MARTRSAWSWPPLEYLHWCHLSSKYARAMAGEELRANVSYCSLKAVRSVGTVNLWAKRATRFAMSVALLYG